jgi:lysozyme
MALEGLDVSKFQGDNIDWGKVAAAGAKFCFIRASYGAVASNEPNFGANWVGARGANLTCGAYHFLVPTTDMDNINAQADLFLSTFKSNVSIVEIGYLPAVLDVEADSPISGADYMAAVKTWIARVEADARFKGLSTIIYTRKSFWDAIGDGSLSGHPHWVADYSQDPPRLPNDWGSWTFFQYTKSGSVDGVTGDVDQNRFAGEAADLAALTKTAGG